MLAFLGRQKANKNSFFLDKRFLKISPFKAENQRGQEGHSGPGLGPHTSDGGNLAYIVHTNKLFKKQLTVIPK